MSTQAMQQKEPYLRAKCGQPWLCVLMLLAACKAVPRVEVELGDETSTSESGGRFEIRLKLAQKPRGVISVYAVSSDQSEGRPSDAVLFDVHDWDRPQTLTVTGVDDDDEDGDVSYRVALYERSSLRGNAPILIATIELVNRDDEIARFDALGDLAGGERASQAADVSTTGDVVVGWSVDEDGDQAVRWTLASGLEALGGTASRANAVSPDGLRVVGSVAEPSYEKGRAAVQWHGSEPYQVLEGPRQPPDGPISLMVVEGRAVLDDGRVFGTCIQYGAYGEPLACRFQAPHEVQVFFVGHVFAADAAGDFAGTLHSERHAPFHSFADYDQLRLPYPDGVTCDVNAGCLAEARDFSDAGALIVGTSHVPLPGSAGGAASPLFDIAFTFDPERGALSLPDLEGGELRSGAYAVSADGAIIAGFGSDAQGQHALVWLERTPVPLADLVRDARGAIPDGFELLEVRALSADGRTFVGNGRNAQGAPEGFRVVLPHAP